MKYLLVSLALVILFTGCSDKKNKKDDEKLFLKPMEIREKIDECKMYNLEPIPLYRKHSTSPSEIADIICKIKKEGEQDD